MRDPVLIMVVARQMFAVETRRAVKVELRLVESSARIAFARLLNQLP